MKRIKPHHIISVLAGGSLIFAVIVSNKPLFSSLEQFVLVAEEEIHLAGNVQTSSGDIASNGRIFVSGENIINGNLFANEIRVAGGTTINSNVSFNKFHLADTAEILGEESTPISLPIIQLPEVPEIQPQGDDIIIENEETISPGTYNKIDVKEGAKLTLVPGGYSLNELILRNNSKLIYSSTTTLNIRQNLKIQNKVLIASNTNIPPTALTINFSPELKFQGKNKEPKVAGPNVITVGEDSFISFKLVAPNSKVIFGNRVTFRGQILAKEIQVGEDSILSLDVAASLQPRLEDIVSTEEGDKFVVNQVILQLIPNGSFADANIIANSINGRIVGTIPSINLYQLVVPTITAGELEIVIQQLIAQQNPKIKNVSENIIISLVE